MQEAGQATTNDNYVNDDHNNHAYHDNDDHNNHAHHDNSDTDDHDSNDDDQ
jgi:hypothetical protein